jgi:arylsulfatase A-like enzyme
MPLAMMWADGIKKPGRKITDFVSHIDFAATFLEIAGIGAKASGMQPMTGKSLVSIFQSEKEGRVDASDNCVLVGKERHDTGRPNDEGYPIRGIISDNFVFLKNFKPDRWPTGMPETGYLDCDGGPTKTLILDAFNSESHQLWRLSFGKRAGNEFYNLKKDPDCMENIADKEDSKTDQLFWSDLLMKKLKEQEDPRVVGNGDVFDSYLVFPAQRDFYKRFRNGEQVKADWVRSSDFRPWQNPEFSSK